MPGTLTTTTTQTLQTTSSLLQQVGTVLNNSVYNQQYNLGNFVQSVGILPFIPSKTIKFTASGLKPNTRLYAYFSNVPVSAWCAPVLPGYAIDTVENSQKCEPFGTPLYSDANGRCTGVFQIPPNTFASQDNTFELNDISDLSQGQNDIETQADAVYHGSTMTVAMGQSLLNTRQTVLSSTEVKQQQISQGLAVATDITQTYVPDPPPAAGGGSGCGCGSIICTKLYKMGLMDERIYKADEAFGAMLRETDPAVYEGYLRWAQTVVKWLDGKPPKFVSHKFIVNVTYNLALPWAKHMAYEMGVLEKDNIVGKFLMTIGRPISKLISKLPKSNKKIGSTTEYLIFSTLYVVHILSKLFGNKFVEVKG